MSKTFLLKHLNNSHLPTINSWLIMHGVTTFPLESLPKNGYIVYDGAVPITAAWLCPSENIGFIESIISNPSSIKEIRRSALIFMVRCIEKEARSLGCNRLICTPERTSLARIFVEAEWNSLPTTVYYMYKELN